MSRLGSSQTGQRAIFSKIDRTGHSHDTLALEKLPRATGDRGQSSRVNRYGTRRNLIVTLRACDRGTDPGLTSDTSLGPSRMSLIGGYVVENRLPGLGTAQKPDCAGAREARFSAMLL